MNIYLIGLPGSGKSTVARKLGEILNLEVIDLDGVIEKDALMFIDEIFDKIGEKGFRKLETNALIKVKDKKAIISCGGGIVTEKINKDYLNGVVIYIDARLETIKKRLKNDYQRPLLLSTTLETIEEQRFLQYQNFADVNISNDLDIDSTINSIIKYLEEVNYEK